MTHGLILAAGMGRRLGHDKPKALIEWGSACIIDHQLDNLAAAGIENVWVVTGFQANRVRSHIGDRPGVHFVENARYMDTNTSKSMALALAAMPAGDVVMLNGDVVFDAGIVEMLAGTGSALAVDPKVCGDEEIKYKLAAGRLVALSKEAHGEGEAVGINRFAAADRPLLEKALAYVADGAYFERAVEHMLPYTAAPVRCVDIGDLRAIEIDFPEDLEQAKRAFA